jgi:GntR family transcriptional regulator
MNDHLSISQKLHEDLADVIANAEHGQRLPSEPKLARELGVSRATLREAMRTFETRGVLRRKQGSGTYVVHPPEVIESGLEVLESINTLASKIDLPVSLGEWNVENRLPSSEEAEALDMQGYERVISVSRSILAEDRPIAYLIDVLPEDVLAPDEVDPHFSGSVLDLLLERGAPTLLSARTEINAVTAPREIARCLGIQTGDVLMFFKAFLFTDQRRVVDYSFSYFLPGYFRFHVVRRVGGL